MTKIIQVGNTTPPTKRNNPQRGRVYDPRGIAPTICTMGGGNLQPQIMEYKIIQKYGDRGTDNYSVSDISHTIPSNPMSDREQLLLENNMEEKVINYRIRKLTPRECFRLMDVDESNIDKIQAAGISKTQQYKMAGNSIVVACMEGIFRNLFDASIEPDTLF